MIENVRVSNFKCIKEEYLENLTPIVGIWGRNGSGKSSLLQAIMWVAKNGGNYDENGIYLSTPKNIIFGHDTTTNVCSVEVTFSDGNIYQMSVGGGVPAVTKCGKSDKIRYFPPWRHISTRSSPIDRKIDSNLGINGHELHTFMHYYLHRLLGDIQRGDKKASETYDKINAWAEKIGFGSLLDAQEGSDHIMGTYHDAMLNLDVPIFDGGFGGNSFLPILLEGYSYEDGILLIEEPEISLHPAAQSEVLDFFVEMVSKRKHQVIFTSHSEYIVKKIARLLREEKINQDLISIYVAKKEGKSGTIFEKKNNNELVSRFEKKQDIILELTRRT